MVNKRVQRTWSCLWIGMWNDITEISAGKSIYGSPRRVWARGDCTLIIFTIGLIVSNLKRARTPSPETPNKMAPIQDMIEQNINENTVMVFSKSTCPFCKKVSNVLWSSVIWKIFYHRLSTFCRTKEDLRSSLIIYRNPRTVVIVLAKKNPLGKRGLRKLFTALLCAGVYHERTPIFGKFISVTNGIHVL